GLTPLVSMLHELVTGIERQVGFIYACDNGALHPLADEVRALMRSREHLRMHTCYRYPTGVDRAAKRFDSEGLVTSAVIQNVLPIGDCEAYVCGPPGFMHSVYRTLLRLGLHEQ